MIQKLIDLVEIFFRQAKIADEVLELKLERTWFTRTSTIGELYINGQFECYTLEDEDKLRQGKAKVNGVTSIPFGTYDIDITYSPKYKRQMPLLKDVPGFTGVRIHSGNTAKDTEGCVLVGQTKGANFVGRSRRAYNALFKKLQKAKEDGKKIIIRID